ncbi:thioredoxin family protein [Bacillus mycoides]|uniref:thioredoxin family protein n=1 Tax=Bacillus mycoides TaxID=1405 RepID=UPI003D030486
MKLIKFEQDNCTPCKMLAKALKEDFGKVIEVDEVHNLTTGNDDTFMLAGEFDIEKTPVLLLLDDNGKEIDRHKGVGITGVSRVLSQRGLI